MVDDLIAKLLHRIEQLEADVKNLKLRVTPLEEGRAALNGRVDRVDVRLDRIQSSHTERP